jgi:hypothetical protein
MTRMSKFLIAATLAVAATSAFADAGWQFKPGEAHMCAGPGKLSAMAMAPSEKNREAMMRHATKVPSNTIFRRDNGELYSVSGTLEPTGKTSIGHNP